MKSEGEYEALRQRHVADLEGMLPEYVGRIEWPAERVRDERRRALRALVTVAAERSPWHRERLAGIDPDGLSEADIEGLPVMTKTDLMDNFDDLVTDRRITRELQVRQTRRGADVRVVTDAEIDAALVGLEIGEALAALGLDQPEVTLTRVATLDRQASGKLKRFVPLSR